MEIDDKVYYQEVHYKYVTTRTVTYRTNIYPVEEIRTRFIILTPEGLLTIDRGYAWDGASGPAMDSKTNMRASLIHDALIQLVQTGLLDKSWKMQIDLEYFRVARQDKMWHIRAGIELIAIQGHDWEETKTSEEMIAP